MATKTSDVHPPAFNIHAAIPHREPMLLIDEVVSLTPGQIVCRKTIRDNEFFLQGHYPGHAIVPGVILCECAMQAGAILLSEQVEDEAGIPVATRLNNVKFKKMVKPGDTIEVQARLREHLSDAFFLDGKVMVDGKLAARLDFACTLTPTLSEDSV
ncbi:MAG: beta-hydroxyacyl-ACP dehydratase [Planctomycetaceae bacterium]|nr:beta-hydroxyacyl-ACP dehydratase [Planctomycetaceae bacterium]MBP60203.1 beta-hydroxyacyl-ACP dehydratase [Planctomycetaceae bacterium]